MQQARIKKLFCLHNFSSYERKWGKKRLSNFAKLLLPFVKIPKFTNSWGWKLKIYKPLPTSSNKRLILCNFSSVWKQIVWSDLSKQSSAYMMERSRVDLTKIKAPLKIKIHSGRSHYIDLLVIRIAVLTMFQEIWSKFKNPSTNWQQFPKHGTGHFSNQFS